MKSALFWILTGVLAVCGILVGILLRAMRLRPALVETLTPSQPIGGQPNMTNAEPAPAGTQPQASGGAADGTLPPPPPPSTQVTPSESPRAFKVRVYWGIYVILLALYVTTITYLLSLAWETRGDTFQLLGLMWNIGFGIALGVAIHLAYAIVTVAVDENAGVTLLQMPIAQIGKYSGPFILPFYPLTRLGKNTRKVIQVEFPGDPEKVFKGTDDEYDKLPLEQKQKFLRPIRITTGGPGAGKSGGLAEGDILETRQTLDIVWYVRLQIQEYFMFISTIHTEDDLVKQVEDTGRRVLAIELGRRTPGKIIEELVLINDALLTTLNKIVEDWGVVVIEAGLPPTDLGHTVATTLRNVTAEKAKAIQTRVAADATSYKLEIEGRGRGLAREAELAGEGKGMEKFGKSIGVAGTAVLAAKTAEVAVQRGNVVILGEAGLSSLLGLIPTAQAVLNRPQPQQGPGGAAGQPEPTIPTPPTPPAPTQTGGNP